jgi:AcrR family transcriptional regulator
MVNDFRVHLRHNMSAAQRFFMSTTVSAPTPRTAHKRSFREQMHLAREDAIVSAVNRLLAEKGFEAMTVDEVAAEVGIAKASLYKHFPSKEDLAAAAMVQGDEPGQGLPGFARPDRPPQELLRGWPAGPWRCSWPGKCPRCRAKTPACGPP